MFVGASISQGLNFCFDFQDGQAFLYGIRFRDTNQTARHEHAGHSAQDSTAERSPSPSYGILRGYIMFAPDSMVPVLRLKTLYESVASKDDIAFKEFLRDMLKNRGISKVTKPNTSTGKSQKFIDGLALTESGKRLWAESK
jgi:hypothetical protein